MEDGFPVVEIGQTGEEQGVGARFGAEINRGAIQEEMQVGSPVGRGGTWEKVQTKAVTERSCHQPQMVSQLWGKIQLSAWRDEADR